MPIVTGVTPVSCAANPWVASQTLYRAVTVNSIGCLMEGVLKVDRNGDGVTDDTAPILYITGDTSLC